MPAGRGPRPDPTPLDVAARLLARTPLSEAALHERLVLKGYQPETAARTVTRCRELGYVSDQRLAADRARSLRARGAGSLKMAMPAGAPRHGDIDISALARKLGGRPLSDVAFVVREGGPLAARSGKTAIDGTSLDAALSVTPARSREVEAKRGIGFVWNE